MKLNIILILFMFSLSGCISLPARNMSKPVDLNHDYKMQITAEEKQVNRKWWLFYDDEVLNLLMVQAFLNNPNINQMHARLAQAQASVKQSKSAQLPSLTATGKRNEYNGDTALNHDFNLSGATTFEIDLWGKNRANTNAAKLLSKASHADIKTAEITLSASIVENWLQILSLLEQENLLQKQIDTNRTVLSLQEKRFEMGLSSALDILQQEERLASSEALLPDILSQKKQSMNNISLLIGSAPYSNNININNINISEKPFPQPLPIPSAGIPSDLLDNRPDIIASWLRLISSDWAAKAAWANRLPDFNLSAIYSTSNNALDGLFNTWIVNMIAEITAPIFDGGSRKAEQLRQKALSDESFHAYRETVLTAVIEVENALVRNAYQDKKLNALQMQLTASRKTLEQAHVSYVNGNSDYINVLNSLNNTQFLEQQITSEKLIQAQMRVQLYRALGGQNIKGLEKYE